MDNKDKDIQLMDNYRNIIHYIDYFIEIKLHYLLKY